MCSTKSRGKLRTASASDMGDRVMEFVSAHPDSVVRFESEPRAERGSEGWVWAAWAETGTFCGESCGVKPDGGLLEVC